MAYAGSSRISINAAPFTLERVSVGMINCMVTQVAKISAFTSQGCRAFGDRASQYNSGKLEPKPLRKEKKVFYNLGIP